MMTATPAGPAAQVADGLAVVAGLAPSVYAVLGHGASK